MTVDLSQFEVYIVGGYVRDRLLGLEAKDHDFVVCGATVEDMLNAGFSQVGAEFPVFLHPITNDEFALARTERKTGPGYHGFECFFDPSVTIEEDLMRRDLTINAMARRVLGFNELGHAKLDDIIIDPFNGQQDLRDGVIRHTSEAFQDDPVRVLRAARFAARYDFRVADETWDLMKWMVRDGELDHLTAERVWLEMEKAMKGDHPGDFFRVLNIVDAIPVVMPELGPVIEDAACVVDKLFDQDERLAMMTMGLPYFQVTHFFDNLKAPADVKRRAQKAEVFRQLIARWHLQPTMGAMNTIRPEDDLTVEACMNILMELDVLRMPDEFDFIVQAHNTFRSIPSIGQLLMAKEAFVAVRFADLKEDQQRELKGPEVGDALLELRRQRVTSTLQI